MNLRFNQKGFALVTAILMLFAATVLGLMVMNSSEVEILLSGAQQRYEDSFNTTEGGASLEATAVGTSAEIRKGTAAERSYAVVNPSLSDQILSPTDSTAAAFDPGADMTIGTPYVVDLNTSATSWPTENLLLSLNNTDNQFDYQYRTVFLGAGTTIPKGYSAEKFTNYQFEMTTSRTTTIEMGGNKIGPKISL